jgi:hypothetical protein
MYQEELLQLTEPSLELEKLSQYVIEDTVFVTDLADRYQQSTAEQEGSVTMNRKTVRQRQGDAALRHRDNEAQRQIANEAVGPKG